MHTRTGLINTGESGHRPDLGIRDHPVFQALPAKIQSMMQAHSTPTALAAGEPLVEDDHLSFILAGVVGLFPDKGRICVATVVAGSVHGWDHALERDNDRPQARALIDSRICRVPSSCILEGLGRDWLTRLVARQSSRRFNLLAAEAACNASHRVQERLAKWLVHLYCGANGAPLHLTQGDFGGMLGVQRTSINAAAGRLQDEGLVRFGRGKVQILDLAGLRAASCGCGAPERQPLRPPASLPTRPAEPSSWFLRDAPAQDTAA